MFNQITSIKKAGKLFLARQGFTLIELVVVVIIVGILVSIAMPNYLALVEKSRTSEAFSTLKAIYDSQMRHSLEFQSYGGTADSPTISGLDINITDPGRFFDFANGVLNWPPDSATEFIATAARTGGTYTYRINEFGNFSSIGIGAPPFPGQTEDVTD